MSEFPNDDRASPHEERVVTTPQAYRAYGPYLVDPSMTIVAFGPWSGEYGMHVDFLNLIADECDRRRETIDAPTMAIPAEMPPVEEPSLFWVFMVAVPRAFLTTGQVRILLRRMHLRCQLPSKNNSEPWAEVLRGRLIAPVTRQNRLQSRIQHATRCFRTTIEILSNACAVGREFQEPHEGKEA